MAPPQWAYQVDNFEPPPDEELVCSICRGIFCDPVQCPCNHVFCRLCISKWLQSNRNCPICRKRATRYSLQEVVPLIKNMIMKLTLRCRNSENGCGEKFTLEGCEIHMKDCIFEMVQCKNKPCKQKFFRKDVGDHELNDCPHRYVRCKICNLKISSLSPKTHNCVSSLRRMVKRKDNIIKKKEQEIVVLQSQINMMNESNRRYSDASSLASISTADIMISLADAPSLSSGSSGLNDSMFSDGADTDSPPRWSDDDEDYDDSQTAGGAQTDPTADAVRSVATQFRNDSDSRVLSALAIYLDQRNAETAQSSTPGEAVRSTDVENNDSESRHLNSVAVYFGDQDSIEITRSSSYPEDDQPFNEALRNTLPRPERYNFFHMLVDEYGNEIPHSSTSAVEADSSIVEAAEPPAFDETFQPRRPTKRRHPPQVLSTSDDDNGESAETPSLPSPKRCWRSDLKESSSSHPTSESSSLSSGQVNDIYMAAGPSFVSSSTAEPSNSGINTKSRNSKNRSNKHSSGETSKTVTTPSPNSLRAVPAPTPGAVFERTIALLEQYNLESDPEWLPEFSSHGGNDTTSDSEASIDEPVYIDGRTTSSEESTRSEVDSSDSYLDPEASTIDLLRRCFGDDDDDDDDDPEWEPL